MEDGKVNEFDTPLALLNGGTQFAQMVEKTGVDTAHNLCQMAIEAERRSKNKTLGPRFTISVN